MTDDIDWEILDRYFSGQCTPEQAGRIDRWAAEPARAELLASARATWEATGVVPRRFDVDLAWAAVHRRMGAGAGAAAAAPSTVGIPIPRATPVRFALPRNRGFQYAAAAAAAVLLLAAGAVSLGVIGRRENAAVHAAAPREYLTRPAQRADFHLKDGTHVLLGVASRLVVPSGFGKADREVFLEGEAYFDVRHDAASKFLVHTAAAVTEDIGTAFVVRAYPADSGAQVAVAEGRVVLHSGTAPDGHGTLLSRGQVGKTDRGGPVSVLDAGDLAPYLGWTEGRLVFKDAPLREALPRLSRWFDLDFTLSDSSLGSRRLTASLGDQPTPEMLDLLALSLGVRLERRGDRVTLYARPVAR